MTRATALALALAILATPAAADEPSRSLCDVPAEAARALIEGAWSGASRVSVETLDTSSMRRAVERVRIAPEGYVSDATALLRDGPLPLEAPGGPLYDVDAVDDLLDATESADLADALSDTPCGPERLPQLRVALAEGDGIRVEATYVLIPYFTDRVLHLTEATWRSGEVVVYLTAAALLRPDPG